MAHEKRTVPKFRSEREEREFWRKHDSSEYISWENARPAVFSKLRPSTRAISIRLPESLLAELRALANKIDIPYQSLIKIFLAEKVKENLHRVLSKSHS